MKRTRYPYITRRQLLAQVDGWQRWDRVYQWVLSWNDALVQLSPLCSKPKAVNQEDGDACRDACARLDADASSRPNH